jgi:hypothetical protein
MPKFDPSLDKELFAESVEINGQRLTAAVMCYNDGMAKLHIKRERLNKDGEATFAKLGRMSLDEIKALQPLIQKAIEFMEK